MTLLASDIYLEISSAISAPKSCVTDLVATSFSRVYTLLEGRDARFFLLLSKTWSCSVLKAKITGVENRNLLKSIRSINLRYAAVTASDL